jgi:hypothetical protein
MYLTSYQYDGMVLRVVEALIKAAAGKSVKFIS